MSRLALLNEMPTAWNALVGRNALEHQRQFRRSSIWIAYIFAFAIFAVDCSMPVDGALAMLHILPIALVLGTRRLESLINLCSLCVLLTVAGYFIGTATTQRTEEVIQRGASLVAMGLMAWVGWQLVESVEAAQQYRIDVCLRQVAEDAATFFRSMVDHVPIGIYRTDLSGNFVYVNEEFCQMFGSSVDDLLGKPQDETIPQWAAKQSGSMIRKVIDLGQLEERIEKLTIGEHERYMKVI